MSQNTVNSIWYDLSNKNKIHLFSGDTDTNTQRKTIGKPLQYYNWNINFAVTEGWYFQEKNVQYLGQVRGVNRRGQGREEWKGRGISIKMGMMLPLYKLAVIFTKVTQMIRLFPLI